MGTRKVYRTTLNHDFDDSTWKTAAPTKASTTLASTAISYTGNFDMTVSGTFGGMITVSCDFDGTPTDDVDVAAYPSIDGTNFDDVGLGLFRMDNGVDPQQRSFKTPDFSNFRLGFQQTGATDTHSINGVKMQNWIVSGS